MTPNKPIIGLAGGIGSGKSEVARVLASLGGGVIDSDELNGLVLEQPEVIETIRSWWGDAVIGGDGRVDRSRLGSVVFADEKARRRLEALQHPRIAAMREALIRQYKTDDSVRLIVLNSPLLYETGLDKRCDAVLFVDAEGSTRLERVKRTRGWSEEEFFRREKSQIALDTKKEKADYRVGNNSSLDDLRRQVKGIILNVLA